LIDQLSDERIIVGRVSGLYGVKGWVKVYSFTSPSAGIFAYRPWYLRIADQKRSQSRLYEIAEHRVHGKGLIARLDGVVDRDSAEELVGAEILVDRNQFKRAESDEYYWADLVGLKTMTTDDRELGTVVGLLETGANDVLVVSGDRRRLIPFLIGTVIQKVDLESRVIIADWDPDF
jgi:16S rRNA processing protein RimM